VNYEEYITIEEHKYKMDEHWPYVSSNNPIYEADKVTGTINSGGKLLERGFIKTGDVIKGGIQKASNYLESKI